MRVAVFAHKYPPGQCAGAEVHLHSMLKALASRGHEVHVLLSKQEVEAPYEVDGVKVWGKVTDAEESERTARAMLADVIVSHLDNTYRAMRLGEWNNIPVVLVHHNTFDQTVDALDCAGRVDLVVCNSHAMVDDLQQRGVKRDVTGIIVRPVLDLAPFERFDRNEWPGLNERGKVTLVNLREASDGDLTKGGEMLRWLAENMPEREFLGVTGAYGPQADLSDLPNVEVIPHVPHEEMAARVFDRTRILLMPSSYESWGRVASEALGSGIPVIASPTPGLWENLRHAVTFARLDTPNRWADAIQALDAPEAMERAVRRSRQRFAQLAQLGRDDEALWVRTVEALTNDKE